MPRVHHGQLHGEIVLENLRRILASQLHCLLYAYGSASPFKAHIGRFHKGENLYGLLRVYRRLPGKEIIQYLVQQHLIAHIAACRNGPGFGNGGTSVDIRALAYSPEGAEPAVFPYA